MGARYVSGGMRKIRRKIAIGRVAPSSFFSGRNEREAYVAAARTGVWGRFQRPRRKSLERDEFYPFLFIARTFEWCARLFTDPVQTTLVRLLPGFAGAFEPPAFVGRSALYAECPPMKVSGEPANPERSRTSLPFISRRGRRRGNVRKGEIERERKSE